MKTQSATGVPGRERPSTAVNGSKGRVRNQGNFAPIRQSTLDGARGYKPKMSVVGNKPETRDCAGGGQGVGVVWEITP